MGGMADPNMEKMDRSIRGRSILHGQSEHLIITRHELLDIDDLCPSINDGGIIISLYIMTK